MAIMQPQAQQTMVMCPVPVWTVVAPSGAVRMSPMEFVPCLVPTTAPAMTMGIPSPMVGVANKPLEPATGEQRAATASDGRDRRHAKAKVVSITPEFQRDKQRASKGEHHRQKNERGGDSLHEGNDKPHLPVLLGSFKEHVWPSASTQSGSRLIQKRLQQSTTAVQVQVAEQLRGHVWEAAISREANYVLQKCIEVLPPERVQFFIDEMRGRATDAAQHRYACRVLERLIEHCSSEQVACLIDEVVPHAHELCRHNFGNFVVQHVLQYGSVAQQHELVSIILQDVRRLARHRVGNHVVVRAMSCCDVDDKQRLAQALLPELDELSRHHCGSFVAREVKHATH